jgi:polyhydroxybutyrate depolymerase
MAMISLLLLVGLQTRGPQTFEVNGLKREALVVAPASKEPAPLVFVFHGHGGNMRQSRRSFRIDRLWPEAIVVYPQGLPTKGMTDPEGRKNGWQKQKGEYEDRDLAFFDAMLAKLKKEHKIDAKRIYATGHSNGGRFTCLLWAQRHDIFAAVAPSGSPATGLIRDLKPLSAFFVAGERDQLVPIASQRFSIDAIRPILKTDAAKARTDGLVRIESGPNGIELGTYIYPGTHTYPHGAAVKTVEFFKRHRK